MNTVVITDHYDELGLFELELTLTRTLERKWKETVFPFLFDGTTTGARSRIPKGLIRYRLLIYNATLVQTLKQLIANAIMQQNGQLN